LPGPGTGVEGTPWFKLFPRAMFYCLDC